MKPARDLWDYVTRRGKKIARPSFTLYALKLDQAIKPRIVTSQKVSKLAVIRNRVRRRLRDTLQKQAPPRLGLVIITRPQIVQMTYEQIKTEIAEALAKVS